MTPAEARQAPAQMLVDASAYLFDHVPMTNPGRLAFTLRSTAISCPTTR